MASPVLPKYDITFTEQFKTALAQAWEKGIVPNLELTYYVGTEATTISLHANYNHDYPAWSDDSTTSIYCNAEGENAILQIDSDKASLQIKVETVNAEYTDDFAAAVLQVMNDYA